MYMVQTQVSFEAAHRLFGVDTYSKECRDNVHGHSYKVTIKATTESLDEAGMVIDFKLFKTIIKREIEDKYDHVTILRTIDPLLPAFKADGSAVVEVEGSPTAEWMAQHFCETLQAAFDREGATIYISSVAVQETENNIATYFPQAKRLTPTELENLCNSAIEFVPF